MPRGERRLKRERGADGKTRKCGSTKSWRETWEKWSRRAYTLVLTGSVIGLAYVIYSRRTGRRGEVREPPDPETKAKEQAEKNKEKQEISALKDNIRTLECRVKQGKRERQEASWAGAPIQDGPPVDETPGTIATEEIKACLGKYPRLRGYKEDLTGELDKKLRYCMRHHGTLDGFGTPGVITRFFRQPREDAKETPGTEATEEINACLRKNPHLRDYEKDETGELDSQMRKCVRSVSLDETPGVVPRLPPQLPLEDAKETPGTEATEEIKVCLGKYPHLRDYEKDETGELDKKLRYCVRHHGTLDGFGTPGVITRLIKGLTR